MAAGACDRACGPPEYGYSENPEVAFTDHRCALAMALSWHAAFFTEGIVGVAALLGGTPTEPFSATGVTHPIYPDIIIVTGSTA